jgi:hypothetical protein
MRGDKEPKMKTSTKVRGMALLTGGVLTVSSLAAPGVQAKTSSKDYKTGAVVLGALGVILATQGKTVPAVVAGAGAYYAYKKSKDRRYNYANRYPTSSRDRYSANNRSNNQNVYPDADASQYDDAGYNSLNATSKANGGSSVVID